MGANTVLNAADHVVMVERDGHWFIELTIPNSLIPTEIQSAEDKESFFNDLITMELIPLFGIFAQERFGMNVIAEQVVLSLHTEKLPDCEFREDAENLVETINEVLGFEHA